MEEVEVDDGCVARITRSKRYAALCVVSGTGHLDKAPGDCSGSGFWVGKSRIEAGGCSAGEPKNENVWVLGVARCTPVYDGDGPSTLTVRTGPSQPLLIARISGVELEGAVLSIIIPLDRSVGDDRSLVVVLEESTLLAALDIF